MASGFNPAKLSDSPAHNAIDSTATGDEAKLIKDTPLERLDDAAMDSAKRATKRIHEDEGRTPGTQIFTK